MPPGANGSRHQQAMLDAVNDFVRSGAASVDPETVMNAAIAKLGGSRTDQALKRALLSYWNDLLRGGLVAPGDANGSWSTVAFHVTGSGQKALQHASRDPINQAGYLAYLDQEASLDHVTRGYVEEALNTYRSCCYK